MFRMISKERLCEGSLDKVSLIAVDPSSSALTSLVTTEGGLENTINDEPPASNVAELSVRDQRQQRHQLVRDLTNFETGRAKSLRGVIKGGGVRGAPTHVSRVFTPTLRVRFVFGVWIFYLFFSGVRVRGCVNMFVFL
jgi:hypothetical protein